MKPGIIPHQQIQVSLDVGRKYTFVMDVTAGIRVKFKSGKHLEAIISKNAPFELIVEEEIADVDILFSKSAQEAEESRLSILEGDLPAR